MQLCFGVVDLNQQKILQKFVLKNPVVCSYDRESYNADKFAENQTFLVHVKRNEILIYNEENTFFHSFQQYSGQSFMPWVQFYGNYELELTTVYKREPRSVGAQYSPLTQLTTELSSFDDAIVDFAD